VKIHSDFEKNLVEIMSQHNLSMREALLRMFILNGIDTNSVFSLVDFLEEMLYDLNKVQFFMMVYTGQISDIELKRLLNDAESKNIKG
jgi:hypothetical protein